MDNANPFPAEPDHLRSGDVLAKQGDFKVYANTRFCGLAILEPKVGKAMALDHRDPDRFNAGPFSRTGIDTRRIESMGLSVGTADGYTSNRSLLYNYYNPEDMKRLKLECPNNGENILITHYISMNSSGTPYRVSFTLRQDNKFWENQ